MSDAQELALIQKDIDATRQRIALDRRLLSDQLAAHGGGPDTIDELLTLCDEFGATPVRDRLATHPDAFQLQPIAPGRLAIVAQLLHQLTESGAMFDNLVSARENILARLDTSRQRVYPWFGREFQIDASGRFLQFADTPTLPEPMAEEMVPNRVSSNAAPDRDALSRRRQRRDRDR
jgi:hypothetical protein